MTTLIIIRHGYSMGNKEKKFTGQNDVPLDEIGFQQAESTAKYIIDNFKVDAIYSSDLSRAYETVKPISNAIGLPITTLTALREVNVGSWQGKLISEIEKEFPENLKLYKKSPGLIHFDNGESYKELIIRVQKAMEQIAEDNDRKTVVIGTHGGVIRALRAAWNKIPLDKLGSVLHVPNGSVTIVEYENKKTKFKN